MSGTSSRLGHDSTNRILWRRLLGGTGTWLLDRLVPPRCAGCGERETWLCRECDAVLPRLPPTHCRVCARPLPSDLQRCTTCHREPPPFDHLTAPFLHEGLARDLVHALKYRGQRHLAPPIAAHMQQAVGPDGHTVVVPVPLHPSRHTERGFNQSALLAASLADRLDLPLVPALERTRPTSPQTGLNHADRLANVRGAFRAITPLADALVLLVDDVCTTGATAAACARALRRGGARSVSVVTATRALI